MISECPPSPQGLAARPAPYRSKHRAPVDRISAIREAAQMVAAKACLDPGDCEVLDLMTARRGTKRHYDFAALKLFTALCRGTNREDLRRCWTMLFSGPFAHSLVVNEDIDRVLHGGGASERDSRLMEAFSGFLRAEHRERMLIKGLSEEIARTSWVTITALAKEIQSGRRVTTQHRFLSGISMIRDWNAALLDPTDMWDRRWRSG